MGGTENAVTLITADGAEPWPRMSKAATAEALADRIAAGAGMTVAVGIRRLPGHDPALPLPAYATAGAAGMDLSRQPRARRTAPTASPSPPAPAPSSPPASPSRSRPATRSSSARAPASRSRQGLTLLNTPGTIDSDYRGEVGVILVNHGAEPVTIAHGDAHRPDGARAGRPHRLGRGRATLAASARGAGGFGSTGTGG